VGVGGFERDGELAGVAPGWVRTKAALDRSERCGRQPIGIGAAIELPALLHRAEGLGEGAAPSARKLSTAAGRACSSVSANCPTKRTNRAASRPRTGYLQLTERVEPRADPFPASSELRVCSLHLEQQVAVLRD